MNNLIKPPATFWIIGIVGLLWNLMGVGAFYTSLNMGEEALAAMTEIQRSLYESTPSWAYVVNAIAVITGVLGCIALLMRKAWAIPLFLVSLIAVVIQMGHALLATNALEAYGVQVIVMPILVTGISLFLWYYAKSSAAKAWIS